MLGKSQVRKVTRRVAVGDDVHPRMPRAQRLKTAHLLSATAVRGGERADEARTFPGDTGAFDILKAEGPAYGRDIQVDAGAQEREPVTVAAVPFNRGAGIAEEASFEKPRYEVRGPLIEFAALKSAEGLVNVGGLELTVIASSQRETHQRRQHPWQAQNAQRVTQQ